MKFLILNGPNLNIMRWSEPGVPGELDYNAIMDYVQAGCEQLGIETDCCQSNHEGDLVDEIQAAAGRVDGIVLNPGAYAHYSVAILDALRLCGVPAAVRAWGGIEVAVTAFGTAIGDMDVKAKHITPHWTFITLTLSGIEIKVNLECAFATGLKRGGTRYWRRE